MMDLARFDEYLEPNEDGLGVKRDTPESIKEEIRSMDESYFQMYGEHLISFID